MTYRLTDSQICFKQVDLYIAAHVAPLKGMGLIEKEAIWKKMIWTLKNQF